MIQLCPFSIMCRMLRCILFSFPLRTDSCFLLNCSFFLMEIPIANNITVEMTSLSLFSVKTKRWVKKAHWIPNQKYHKYEQRCLHFRYFLQIVWNYTASQWVFNIIFTKMVFVQVTVYDSHGGNQIDWKICGIAIDNKQRERAKKWQQKLS